MVELIALTALVLITQAIAELELALKIFALLSIISFVWNHIGNTPLAVMLIAGISWFVLFDYWVFFGGVYLLYTLLMLGASGILVDFFFVSGMGGGGESKPVDSGMDLALRQQQMKKARQAHSSRRMMR